MKSSAYGKIAILLSGLSLAPPLAFAGNINFSAENQASRPMCVYCGGPWFRLGFSSPLPASFPPVEFYTAEDNIFSPFGAWGCGMKAASAQEVSNHECNWLGTLPTRTTTFCVYNTRGVNVRLTIHPDESFTSDKPAQPCNGAGAAAFLGAGAPPAMQALGNQVPPGTVEDAWRFSGVAGETVTVTLKRDGARGSEGKFVQLTLRKEGGAIIESTVGALPTNLEARPTTLDARPITLEARLPKAGNYRIEVGSPPASAKSPFRGYYELDVISTSGQSVVLEPILGP